MPLGNERRLRAPRFWAPLLACLSFVGLIWVSSLSEVLAQQSTAPSSSPATIVTPPDAATLSAVSEAGGLHEIPNIDMTDWERLALRSEAALDGGTLSNESFEVLRALLAGYRAQFLDAQDINAGRIETLRTQIAALGVPAEGTEELPSVQQRRIALEAQLADLRAPVIAADEAYTRANGLIIEIDRVIRARQTEQITALGPSPLQPALWAPAMAEFNNVLRRLSREVQSNLSNEVSRDVALRNAPAAVILVLFGTLFIVFGRRWSDRAGQWVMRQNYRGARVWARLVALGEIVVPLLGVAAVVSAIDTLQVLGILGSLILENVTDWALIILGARWLADRLFSQHDNQRLLPMAPLHRSEARVYGALLAVLFVAHLLLGQLAAFGDFTDGTQSVLRFPLILLTATLLYRLAHLLLKKVVFAGEEADQTPPMRARFVSLSGQAARIIAVLSPVLAAVGYGEGARFLLFPAIATLALAGLLISLQRFTSELFRYLARQGDDEEDSLIAVIIGFALVIASLPVLALIWGARMADITELWTRIGEGFTIGGTRFQPGDLLIFLLVFGVLYSATRLIQSALRNTVLPKTNLDTGGRNAVVSGVGYVGVALAAILSISATGIDLSALAFIFTALSVGIGFGLQNIVQNFVSGIILLIERPIAEGDWIEVNGNMGYVRNISVRSTRIETFDRTDVIVPNGDLISGTVTNYTRGNSIGRVIVPVGVAYGSDTKKVENILLGVAREHDMVLMNPAPSVVFQGFGADSLDFEIRAILRDVNYMLSVKSEMNHAIYSRFAEAGIEIPFAQRDVWIRNPEALGGASPQKPAAASTASTEQGPPQPRRSDDELGEGARDLLSEDET